MLQIRIVSSFTVDPVFPLLDRALGEFGLSAHVRAGPYGQVLQSLLSPASLLHAPGEALAFLVIRAEDLVAGGEPGARADELAAAAEAFRERSNQPLVVLLAEPSGAAAMQFVDRAAVQLRAIADVFVIDAATVRRRYPCTVIHDPVADRLGHVPYTRTYFAALALSMVRFAWRFRQPERKVLVLDCDNTLWQGVCGESGAWGVEIDDGARALQAFARDRSAQGTVVCLASKNAEADVWDVFDNNPDMVLDRQDVVAARINWEPKSGNLGELARTLDLAVDSFVFVDDNPVELAEVAAVHPGVLTVLWPTGSPDAAQVCEHLWALDPLRQTGADRLRVQTYRDNVSRSALRAQSPSFAAFIRSLEIEISLEPMQAADAGRVAQLLVRTTQFNAGNGRHAETALRAWPQRQGGLVLTARVRDRFGDYGLVGVVLMEGTGTVLQVREFVLSCRVLGKGVEHALLRAIGSHAAAMAADTVRVTFTATARNEPVLRFLCAQAHTRRGEDFEYSPATLLAAQLPDDEALAHVPLAGMAGNSRPVVATAGELDAVRVHQRALELADPARLEALLDAGRSARPEDLQWIEPRAGLETALAAIWTQVLRVEPVGRTDPFKALGGTSLDMVRVHRLIQDQLQRELPLADLLSAPTIADLAGLCERAGTGATGMDGARQRAAKQRQMVRSARQASQQPAGISR